MLGFLISCSSTREFSKFENIKGKYIESGIASWYGPNFQGNKTANGETFNTYDLTAAHKTLPFNSIVRVVNESNGKSVIVRINDRGPFIKNRIIDLSKAAAEKIDLIEEGSSKVDIYLLNGTSSLSHNLSVPSYTVQIGSYKKRSEAKKVASKVRNSKVVKAIIEGKIYYRIYVGSFFSKGEALEMQKKLKNQGIQGFVKQEAN